PAAAVLPAPRGRARRGAAEHEPHVLPVQGGGQLPVLRRRQGPGLVLPGPVAGRGGNQGARVVLQRGGRHHRRRRDRGPPAGRHLEDVARRVRPPLTPRSWTFRRRGGDNNVRDRRKGHIAENFASAVTAR